jgi:hypothetical protein
MIFGFSHQMNTVDKVQRMIGCKLIDRQTPDASVRFIGLHSFRLISFKRSSVQVGDLCLSNNHNQLVQKDHEKITAKSKRVRIEKQTGKSLA